MNSLKTALRTVRESFGSKRAEQRLRSQELAELLAGNVELRHRIEELEVELAEIRADSRRVAELRILVEDSLSRTRS